jgi:DNA-binding NarL/FixJ family response regulator
VGKPNRTSGARKGRRGPSVCLISPHPLVLANLRAALERSGFHIQTRQPESVRGGEWQVPKLPRARVYAVDSHAPRLAVQRLVESILSRSPNAGLIVLAEKFGESAAFPFLRMGVRGLLPYSEIGSQLERAVEAVARGSFWVPRAVLGRFVDSILHVPAPRASDPGNLSRREREVMDALLENLANKEIAARLNISERTVKFHVSRILSKYQVQRRADLIVRFYQERAQFS